MFSKSNQSLQFIFNVDQPLVSISNFTGAQFILHSNCSPSDVLLLITNPYLVAVAYSLISVTGLNYFPIPMCSPIENLSTLSPISTFIIPPSYRLNLMLSTFAATIDY
ncbi:hypothetical protein FGO68_gene6981 [Halteria grandinella]|uniref:Uncharacterized protein n=1 Tax=Halteria grandinella TaxID=5974 RepID=A0A8J8T7N9_HALGN|nr:hypothetical protein FGO68_gene6981 [Halteria grandinella]